MQHPAVADEGDALKLAHSEVAAPWLSDKFVNVTLYMKEAYTHTNT
jgi:hypothetical protein